MKAKIHNKKFLISVIIFSILLFYFTSTYKYYPGLKVTFSGELDRDVRGRVHWNFGKGFNSLDSIAVRLTAGIEKSDIKLGNVIVEPSGLKSDQSRGYLVWLVISKPDYEQRLFEIKGKHHWGSWINIKDRKKGRQLALFPGSKILFACENNSINLKFFKAPQAGFARITSNNGPERFFDTYGRNPHLRITRITYEHDLKGMIKYVIDPHRNKYLKWLPLPHQKLFGVKFIPNQNDFASVVSGQLQKDGSHFRIDHAVISNFLDHETILYNESTDRQQFLISNLNRISQSRFRLLLLLLQIFTAAILAFISYWISKLKIFDLDKGISELTQSIFFKEKRWFFWFVFLIGILVSTAWLLAEWPGCMTPDSIFVHKETKLLRFTNHHPYIYSFFVLGLYNLFDSPLSVVFFQIVVYNLLFGYFFFYIFKRNFKLYLMIPFIIIPSLSIPIHLYNLTMWKDIPYSLAILFWSLFLVKIYYQRKYENKDVEINPRDIFILSLLYFAICTFRHNGIVYIVYIPITLFFIGSIGKGQVIQFIAISALLFISYFFIFPDYIVHKKYEKESFLNKKIEDTLSEASQVTNNSYYLEDYLSYRVKRFIATLGVSPKATTWFNDMRHPPQRWFSVDEARSEMKVRPKVAALRNIEKNLLNTRNFRGYAKGRFIFWNNLFFLIGFCLILFLYKWLPVSALYSSVFLYQTFFMFFVVWPRWRYLYYIYLGGVFLLPIVALELKTILDLRNKRQHCVACS